MKSCFESLLIALSMYSTLPVKCLNWNAKNLRLAMLFFPIVGLARLDSLPAVAPFCLFICRACSVGECLDHRRHSFGRLL